MPNADGDALKSTERRQSAYRPPRGGAASETCLNVPQLSHFQLIAWLRRRIASGSPAATVRFGDGELRLLRAASDSVSSMEAARRQLLHETGRSFQFEEILEVGAAVERAHEGADILGTLGGDRQTGRRRIWSDHLEALCAKRISAGSPPTALAGCMLNHDLLAALPELVAGRRVSVISCRELRPVIEDQWDVDGMAVFQTPSQYMARKVDGTYEAAMHGLPIWPDAYERIRSELRVRERGEIFLVGAGVFGKELCIQIRDRGGIALDMGSALDLMAGKITRGPIMRLLKLHAEGLPPAEIATKFGENLGVRMDHQRIERFLDTASRYIQ